MDFYEILLEIMNEKSLSIPDVARATGLSDSTIRSIISRKTKKISLEVAFKLSKGLNVSLERLNGDKYSNVDIQNKSDYTVPKFKSNLLAKHNIGLRIKERRKELGLSVDDIATKLNKNRATIYRYENNDIENLPINILEPLAKVLNTTPAYLMGLDINENSEIAVSKDELDLLNNYKKLNNAGKNEAIKRVEELTYITKYIEQENNIIDLPKKEKQIWEEPGKEHLMPIASHDKDGEFTEEDYKHDDDLMDDEDFWK